jgi:hypothetical protein
VWGSKRAILVCAAIAFSASCGEVVRDGQGNSFLVINGMEAASGAEPTTFGGTLRSDVITIVDDVPSVFNDIGRVRFSLGLKDPGSATSPNGPTQYDAITVNRYHVRFIRADGRNTPGVDVPYPFDGALTVTVFGGEVSAGFEIVRHLTKEEPPVQALAWNNLIIATIAEVTFYGRDLAGREVIATGHITINFGNFGDPE